MSVRYHTLQVSLQIKKQNTFENQYEGSYNITLRPRVHNISMNDLSVIFIILTFFVISFLSWMNYYSVMILGLGFFCLHCQKCLRYISSKVGFMAVNLTMVSYDPKKGSLKKKKGKVSLNKEGETGQLKKEKRAVSKRRKMAACCGVLY